MIEEEFRVGDLVKINPSAMERLGKGVIFKIKAIVGGPPLVLASIVRHNNPSMIGEELYLFKSWICSAPVSSKFERRMALCK